MLTNNTVNIDPGGQQESKEQNITRTFNNGSGQLIGDAKTISHPIGNADTIKDPVAHLRALLGRDVVMLPIPKGEKRPILKEWQKTRREVMENLAYLGRLKQVNIGVLLGEASGGLCAIDIDNDAQVEPFLALNPGLRDTLRSKGARGVQIWVRVTTKYPKLTKLVTENAEPWGEWRADGGQSVIHGLHPDGMEYRIVHEATPVEVKFEDIVWPEHLKLPWVKSEFEKLVESDGQPFTIGVKGSVGINHMFFVKKYMLEHQVLFDAVLGDFYEYEVSTGLWKQATQETIKRSFLNDLGNTATKVGIEGLHLKRNDNMASALLALLRTMSERTDVFAVRPDAIHVANGMICFEPDGVVLKSFHPDYLSRNTCPIVFEPGADCPRFKKELLGSALNEDDIVLVQKWAGAVLMGKNVSGQFLIMIGTAGGGKSTLMKVLEHIIGLRNVAQLRTECLRNPFEFYSYVGKTLLTGKDVEAEFLRQKGTSKIKSLVGGDLMDAEKKGKNERVQIRGDFNLGITCNTELNIHLEGDTEAWGRRMMVIKYDRPPVLKPDTGFADYLIKEEGAGILRWMVEGAMALREDLREHGRIKLSDEQQKNVNKLLEQSDSIRIFVNTCVVRGEDEDVTTNELHAAYYEFCEQRGWQPLSAKELNASLKNLMLQIHQVPLRHDIVRNFKDQRGYKGVAINKEVVDAD